MTQDSQQENKLIIMFDNCTGTNLLINLINRALYRLPVSRWSHLYLFIIHVIFINVVHEVHKSLKVNVKNDKITGKGKAENSTRK